MSDLSRRRRFLAPTAELSDEDLMYLTDLDHNRHEAMIAIDPERDRAVGVARYVRVPGDREAAEVAVVVVDDWHRRGIGRALLDSLTERARENGILRYTAVVSPDNDIVLNALDEAGAERTGTTADGEIQFTFELPAEGLGDRLSAALRAAATAPVGFIAQALRRLPFWSGG
jgi:GNAT superfamily N-acetyltransferase